MLMNPPPFPTDLSGPYPTIEDEPEFRPELHLALEPGGERMTYWSARTASGARIPTVATILRLVAQPTSLT